jgi:hypothetical protein
VEHSNAGRLEYVYRQVERRDERGVVSQPGCPPGVVITTIDDHAAMLLADESMIEPVPVSPVLG